MDNSTLHRQARVLRDCSAAVIHDLDSILVAILKPDVSSRVELTTNDFFWGKCCVVQKVATLYQIIAPLDASQVRLIQSGSILQNSQPVLSLKIEDQLCVLEAVFNEDPHLCSSQPSTTIASSAFRGTRSKVAVDCLDSPMIVANHCPALQQPSNRPKAMIKRANSPPSEFIKSENCELSQNQLLSKIREGCSVRSEICFEATPYSTDSAAASQQEEPASLCLGRNKSSVNASIGAIEAAEKEVTKALSSIVSKLKSEGSEESERWMSKIANARKMITDAKTVVGIVGESGAGKSSIINAVLDQKCLLPTSCMRACTAVVVEISYNHADVPYRAEVEFINKEDWKKELEASFGDVSDSAGRMTNQTACEDDEAAIARAKIRAVYPSMTNDMMDEATIEDLMNHENVANVFGSVRSIQHHEISLFHQELSKYIDSTGKDGSFANRTAAEKGRESKINYWPLICKVRMYVKASVLATGTVLVDLPGLQDSNEARTAVAQNYLKNCTALWIVAPINRAVSNRSAKKLLGDAFRRQLRLDGSYNTVTFICSKTDDIDVSEAQGALGLEEELSRLQTESNVLEREKSVLENTLKDLQASISDAALRVESAKKELEAWEEISQGFEEGRTVLAPRNEAESRKRKLIGQFQLPNKRYRRFETVEKDGRVIFDILDVPNLEAYEEGHPEEKAKRPLTACQISSKILEINNTSKEYRHKETAFTQSKDRLLARIHDLKDQEKDIQVKCRSTCIKARNEYSRRAIQQDFVSGIRDLDEEIHEETDPVNFNPKVAVRDYDAIANGLAVFCVPSRGYQILKGRLQKDRQVSSFHHLNETEIPALQAYCQSLTEVGRETSLRRSLNMIVQVLHSLILWSSPNCSGLDLTYEQQAKQKRIWNSSLTDLNNAIEELVSGKFSSIEHEHQKNLYTAFPLVIKASCDQACSIQAKWGAKKKEGGLHWQTYKATVRRSGVFLDNDFNYDLFKPVLRYISPGWEKLFTCRVPEILFSIPEGVYALLVAFHNDIQKHSPTDGSSIAAFKTLHSQLLTYKRGARDALDAIQTSVSREQKDSNREFIQQIKRAMLPAYAIAAAESGDGLYARMRSSMKQHVEQVKHTMYNDSVQHVKSRLDKSLKDAESDLLARLRESIVSVAERDYEPVVSGKSRGQRTRQISQAQRDLRDSIWTIATAAALELKRAMELQRSEAGA